MKTNTPTAPTASTSLVRYDAARRALALCVRVDEVKRIRDANVAVQVYAKQAKDSELIKYATDIRLRAERRAGQLLAEMAKRGERAVRKNMKSQGATSKLADLGITKTQSSKWQGLARLPAETFEAKVTDAKARVEQAMTGHKHHLTRATRNDEWYTPASDLDLARQVLGGIDVTPASNDEAQKVAKAKIYYTKETNGLAHEWPGRVFMNPPYSHPLIDQFVDKLVTELDAGRTTQAIMVVNNSADTEWFEIASDACSAMCLTRGRVKFYRPGGDPEKGKGSPLQGQAYFYFGKHPEKFFEVFKERGTCWTPRRAKP